MFIRILIIAFVVSYFIWVINNKILKKNLAFARIVAITLVTTSMMYLMLASLSYFIESF